MNTPKMPPQISELIEAEAERNTDAAGFKTRKTHFIEGAEFGYSLMMKQAPAKFNEAAAIEQAKHEDSDGYFGFLTGAKWQYSQLSVLIGAKDARIAELEEKLYELTERLEQLGLGEGK